MPKKQIHGVSLTELLVATVIVSIVMVGVIAAYQATWQSQRKSTIMSQLSSETGATMFDIMQNVSLAIGDGAGSPGIEVLENGNNDTLCIRQDRSLTGSSNNTPENFTDDTWVCYSQNGTDVFKCDRTSSGTCAVNPPSIHIGEAVAGGFTARFMNDGVDLFVEVSITNREDPSQAGDPITNPEYQLTSHSSPIAQSGTGP